MPFLKPRKTTPPSVLLDIKTLKCGLRHTVFDPNGNTYTGEWQSNLKHGKGIQVWKKPEVMYDGEWNFGKRHGWGTYSVLVAGSKEYARKYCGQWENDKKHGYGTYFYQTSAVYEGNWSEGQQNGWGRMYYENGDVYEGEWLNAKKHGVGIMQYANGNWYEGSWQENEKNGHGKFHYRNKGQICIGLWVNGSAKSGILTDCGRDEAPTPTKHPIPKEELCYSQASNP